MGMGHVSEVQKWTHIIFLYVFFSVFLGAASMILVVAYPLAKRYTYWPQVVLGTCFMFYHFPCLINPYPSGNKSD